MTWYCLPGFKIIAFIPTWQHFDLSVKFCNPEATRFQSKTGMGTVVIKRREMMEVISTVLGVERNRKEEDTVSIKKGAGQIRQRTRSTETLF